MLTCKTERKIKIFSLKKIFDISQPIIYLIFNVQIAVIAHIFGKHSKHLISSNDTFEKNILF